MSLLLFQLILLLLQDSTYGGAEKNKWVVTGSSKLEIQGSTNVNKFRCLSTKYHGGDTLTESIHTTTGVKFLEGQIILRTRNFDCEHAIITRDLQKTLKSDSYPEVRIKFLQLKENGKTYDGMLEITIAGIAKKYPVTCQVTNENSREKYFVGTNTFDLSDFNLDPPEKFFGTVKVANKVSVNFQLRLKGI